MFLEIKVDAIIPIIIIRGSISKDIAKILLVALSIFFDTEFLREFQCLSNANFFS
jgi:hypothetical protein